MKGVSSLAIALTLIGIVGISSVAVYLVGQTQFAISTQTISWGDDESPVVNCPTNTMKCEVTIDCSRSSFAMPARGGRGTGSVGGSYTWVLFPGESDRFTCIYYNSANAGDATITYYTPSGCKDSGVECIQDSDCCSGDCSYSTTNTKTINIPSRRGTFYTCNYVGCDFTFVCSGGSAISTLHDTRYPTKSGSMSYGQTTEFYCALSNIYRDGTVSMTETVHKCYCEPEGTKCVSDEECCSDICSYSLEKEVEFYSSSGSYGCQRGMFMSRYCPKYYNPETGSSSDMEQKGYLPVEYCVATANSYICGSEYSLEINPGERLLDYCTGHDTYPPCKMVLYYKEKVCVGQVCGDNILSGEEVCDPPGSISSEGCPAGGLKRCLPGCTAYSPCLSCKGTNPCIIKTLDVDNWKCVWQNDIDDGTIGTNGNDADNCKGYVATCKEWGCVGNPSIQEDAKCTAITVTNSELPPDCSVNKYCNEKGECVTKPGTCGSGECDPGENANNCPADCNPICGNNVQEPGENCDTKTPEYITKDCYVGSCLGTKQIKKTCVSCNWKEETISNCDGTVSGTCENGCTKNDKCCGVTCEGRTKDCVDYCDPTNKWCDYAKSVATCTDKCLDGICVPCTLDCGTPSCSYVTGKCGITCSVDSECGQTEKKCDAYCDGTKWCVYPLLTATCNNRCVNGNCVPCMPDCKTPSCSFIVGKCDAGCTTPGEEIACSLVADNCGFKKCQTNGKYSSCYSKSVCTPNQDCVENPTGTFTCQPKDVRITHKLQEYYSVGNSIIVIAEIPYFPIENPVYSTLLMNDVQLQQVECSYTSDIKWSCSFSPVTSGGIYKVKTQLTNPNTGNTVMKEDQLIVRESLQVAFTAEDYIQYIGRDIVVKLSVTPYTAQVTKSLKATLYSGLGLFPEEIPVVPNYVPTGGNTWDVKIPAGQITKSGNLKLQMTIGDVSGQYQPVTKELTLQIAELGLIVKIETPSSVSLASGSKTEQIVVKTYLGNDLTDVDRLEMRVTYAGNEKMFTKNDFLRLDKGKYQLSFTFTQSQNHYFKASAWIGLTSTYVEASVPVTGGPACTCDVTANVCDTECSCDPDCAPEPPWVTYAIAGTVVGVIVLGGALLWRRG